MMKPDALERELAAANKQIADSKLATKRALIKSALAPVEGGETALAVAAKLIGLDADLVVEDGEPSLIFHDADGKTLLNGNGDRFTIADKLKELRDAGVLPTPASKAGQRPTPIDDPRDWDDGRRKRFIQDRGHPAYLEKVRQATKARAAERARRQ